MQCVSIILAIYKNGAKILHFFDICKDFGMKCIQMCHFFSFLSRKIVIFLSRSSLAHLSVGRVVNFGGYQQGSKRANGNSAQDNESRHPMSGKRRKKHAGRSRHKRRLSIPAPDGRRGSGTGSRTNIPDTARTRARILYPSACAQSTTGSHRSCFRRRSYHYRQA